MARTACFVFGFVAVSIIFFGVFDIVRTMALGDDIYDPSAFVMSHFWVSLFQWSLIPAFGALTGLLIVDAARPMAVFASASRPKRSLAIRGAITGAIWVAGLLLLLPAINDMVPDSAALAVSAPIVTALVLLVSTRRVRPGRCVGCGHDLRGTRHLGYCTECGIPIASGYSPAGG